MKLRRLITRRRAKWAGVIATISLATAMVASYWYWPSFTWMRPNTSFIWSINVYPGGMWVGRVPMPFVEKDGFHRWNLDTRETAHRSQHGWSWPFVWAPSLDFDSTPPGEAQHVELPIWIPLLLVALPTGILFYRDRRAKPWQCAKCRYDLRGLEGGVCPECGEER